jgi:orotidine-5'-phosphate decarboxylase
LPEGLTGHVFRSELVFFRAIDALSSLDMEAAAAAKGDVKILAVTVLTSLNSRNLASMGFQEEYVRDLLKLVLLVLLVGTHATAIQRILHTKKTLAEPPRS